MKKLIGLFLLMLGSLAEFSQTQVVPEATKDDFEKMTFEVALNKNSFLLFEPVFVNFKFSNQTGFPQTIYSPSFLRESKLKVNFNGKTSVFEHLSSINGPGVRFPAAVPINWISTIDEMLNSPSIGVYFPEPGNYQVQFVLHSSGGDKTIESNIIDVTIERPTGVTKEASDFMKKHQGFFGQSSWAPEDREGQTLLETFVNKYGESVYGEIAISNLGAFYLAKGEFDKAKAEFEKIKGSQNTIIAKEAADSLADISKRKADLQKDQKEKEKPL